MSIWNDIQVACGQHTLALRGLVDRSLDSLLRMWHEYVCWIRACSVRKSQAALPCTISMHLHLPAMYCLKVSLRDYLDYLDLLSREVQKLEVVAVVPCSFCFLAEQHCRVCRSCVRHQTSPPGSSVGKKGWKDDDKLYKNQHNRRTKSSKRLYIYLQRTVWILWIWMVLVCSEFWLRFTSSLAVCLSNKPATNL